MSEINDELLYRKIQKGAIKSLSHSDHVQLAWEVLRLHPILESLAIIRNSLKDFSQSKGRPELYHETITFAFSFLIHERMIQCRSEDWREFQKANPDLMEYSTVFAQYYSKTLMDSDSARQHFLLPDKLTHQEN